MAINLIETIKIAQREAQKKGVSLDSICVENPEGWRFGFTDKNGNIIPDDTCAMVLRNGVFKVEFTESPSAPIQDGHEVDISRYLNS